MDSKVPEGLVSISSVILSEGRKAGVERSFARISMLSFTKLGMP